MANVEDDTAHFIPLTDLPRVNARTKMPDVFAVLDSSRRNGVVVWDDGQPRSYVARSILASEVLGNAKEALSLTIGELLSRSNTPGLRNAFSNVSVPAGAPAPAGIAFDANAAADLFYSVTGSQFVVGYLCSRDSFKTSVLAPPPDYDCTGPVVHKNQSLGRGRCISCPFPLKG